MFPKEEKDMSQTYLSPTEKLFGLLPIEVAVLLYYFSFLFLLHKKLRR